MLTGRELGLAIAGVLLAAVALGALLHWLWTRLGRRGRDDGGRRLAELAERLKQAEADRAAAGQARDETEAALARELAEAQLDLEATHDALARAQTRVRELEAELERARGGGHGVYRPE